MPSHSWPLLLLILGVSSCSRASLAPSTPGTASQQTDPLARLHKDGGKPWVADEHTRKSIAAMVTAVQAAATDQSAAATTALGKQLQILADRLIQGCTMSGPAHDALHSYLGVLLPGVGAMSGADLVEAKRARAEVPVLLARFGDYFQ